MQNKKMRMGNLNCVFKGSKVNGFFELWGDFTNRVFLDRIEYPSYKTPRFTLHSVKINDNIHGQSVIYGRFVKITVLDIDQEYKNGKLINVDKHIDSAPSSIFVYNIKNHILLYLREHKGAPTIQQFISYFTARVDNERQKQITHLVETGVNIKDAELMVGRADVSYTGLVSLTKLDDVFRKVSSISDLHIVTRLQNGNIDIDGLIGSNQQALRRMLAKKADIKYTYIKSVEGVQEVVKKVSENGAAEFKFIASMYDGKKRTVKNNDLQIDPIVDYDPNRDVAQNVSAIVEEYTSLQNIKEIPYSETTTSQSVIDDICKTPSKNE